MATQAFTAGWLFLREHCTDFQLYTFVTFGITVGVFWVFTLLYMILDLTQKPAFLYKYKIQETKSVGWPEYEKAMKRALLNQVVGLGLVVVLYQVQQWVGYSMVFTEELPSLMTFAQHMLVFLAVEEIGFFYSHWAFHHERFYKPFHKFHHEFKAPIAMACVYAHPLEHIVANLLPLLLGPILVHGHVIELWAWLTIGILSTINGHSGYQMPGFPDAFTHDYHHEAFNYNFGALGICDWLHGTAGKSRKAKMAMGIVDKKEK